MLIRKTKIMLVLHVSLFEDRLRRKREFHETAGYTGPLFAKPMLHGGCGIEKSDEATLLPLSFSPEVLGKRLDGMHVRNALQ